MKQANKSSGSSSVSNETANQFFLTIFGSAVGSFFEWYDYALITYFANQISAAFFPSTDSAEIELLETFTLFGAAYIVRPFGGIFFGWLADKKGRKYALYVTLVLMGIPTFLIACVPPYSSIGYASTAIVFVLRIVQVWYMFLILMLPVILLNILFFCFLDCDYCYPLLFY